MESLLEEKSKHVVYRIRHKVIQYIANSDHISNWTEDLSDAEVFSSVDVAKKAGTEHAKYSAHSLFIIRLDQAPVLEIMIS